MLIECDRCAVRGPACQECVVTFLLGPDQTSAVDLTSEEIAAVEVLSEQGVVPPLRLRLVCDHRDYSDKPDNLGGVAAASH